MGSALKSASVAFLAAAEGTERSEQVVECTAGPNTLVTSRRPQDLPAFCDSLVRVFGGAIG
jgi:protease I